MSQWPGVWPRTRRWAAGSQPQVPPPPWPANLFLQWEMGQGPPHHSHASRMSVAHSCTTLTLWHAIGPQLKKERSRDTVPVAKETSFKTNTPRDRDGAPPQITQRHQGSYKPMDCKRVGQVGNQSEETWGI